MIFKKGDRIKNKYSGKTAEIVDIKWCAGNIYQIRRDNGEVEKWMSQQLEEHWVLDNKKVGEK